jgi:hypothetical protein
MTWEAAMPRIHESTIRSVVYLYATKEDAERGDRAGGTGFLVGVPAENLPGENHFKYAITNAHVIREGFPVIRINTRDGKTESLPLTESDWIKHPDGDDVAIAPLGLVLGPQFDATMLRSRSFVTKEMMKDYDIRPGLEVHFVGRFITHDGAERNLPTVRFGSISVLPTPIYNRKTGVNQESFLVEAHSYAGYSGSPVFVHGLMIWRTDNMPRMEVAPLLGIDWGHIAPRQPVMENTAPGDPERPIDEGWWVNANLGLMAVVPAWKIEEMLMSDDQKKQRQVLENELRAKLPEMIAQADVAEAPPREFTRADMENALRKVGRRLSPSEPDEASSGT